MCKVSKIIGTKGLKRYTLNFKACEIFKKRAKKENGELNNEEI